MDILTNKLLELCSDPSFEKGEATALIRKLNLNMEIIDTQHPNSRTTFLMEATCNANLAMVRLLLENGADPNFILYEDKPFQRENPFWNLQYNDFGEREKENEVGLIMAQLMLEHGANPNITLDDEDLFSYVCFAVFNNDDTPESWEYRSRFFILLIAYGGSSNYCKPKIISAFDKSNMKQYRFSYIPCNDGYRLAGAIHDQNHNVVATV